MLKTITNNIIEMAKKTVKTVKAVAKKASPKKSSSPKVTKTTKAKPAAPISATAPISAPISEPQLDMTDIKNLKSDEDWRKYALVTGITNDYFSFNNDETIRRTSDGKTVTIEEVRQDPKGYVTISRR